MRVLEDMKEVLEDQLKKISKKGDAISPQELDNAYKAVDIIKDIATIEAMEKAEKEQEEMKQMEGQSSRGYSGHWPRYYPPHMIPEEEGMDNYARNNMRSYDGAVNMQNTSAAMANNANNQTSMGQIRDFADDYSERRGRNRRTGRYVSRDGAAYDGSYEGAYGYSEDDAQEKEKLKQKIREMQEKLNNM